MPSSEDEYLSALQERDRREKANEAICRSYTKLADRTTTLQAVAGGRASSAQEEPTASPKLQDNRYGKDKGSLSDPALSDAIAKVRQDLSEAQRSRALLETRVQSITDELGKLKIQSSMEVKRVRELTKEKAVLNTGLRDRDEELKGKAKLLEDIHDETVSLTLQLNMAEEHSRKLQRENQELVDRWMARMGREADAMNDKSKFS